MAALSECHAQVTVGALGGPKLGLWGLQEAPGAVPPLQRGGGAGQNLSRGAQAARDPVRQGQHLGAPRPTPPHAGVGGASMTTMMLPALPPRHLPALTTPTLCPALRFCSSQAPVLREGNRDPVRLGGSQALHTLASSSPSPFKAPSSLFPHVSSRRGL